MIAMTETAEIDPNVPDRQLLQDIADYDAADSLGWLHELHLDPQAPMLHLSAEDLMDDGEDSACDYRISADKIRASFTALTEDSRVKLCCAAEIIDGGLGYGCLDDVDAVLQHACYGRIIFA
ncbi:UNVERIFIED_CONTAM: hypothetical protein RF649_02990 [Kocuria sp. CPCC 205295]|uniref:hypothetical protein n=1 Tax=Kocuria TaxID=57493 RepID=UPI0034D6B70F